MRKELRGLFEKRLDGVIEASEVGIGRASHLENVVVKRALVRVRSAFRVWWNLDVVLVRKSGKDA